MMLMDFMHHSMGEAGDRGLGWLMVISNFREEAPWLYEIGVEVYHALQGHDDVRVAKAIDRFERTLLTVSRGPMAEMVIDSPEMDMAVHELGRMARHLFIDKEGRARQRAVPAKLKS